MILQTSQTSADSLTAPACTVLWTGATGFFGRSLLRYLKAHGSTNTEWHFLSRDPAAFAARWPELAYLPHTTWHQGDLSSLSADQFPPLSHVVHAAADSTDASHLSALQRFDQIETGTRRVLDLAINRGAHRFLLTSSGAVYGRIPASRTSVAEDFHGSPDPLLPANAYGIGKRAAEHLCALYAESYGLEVMIARCFAFVGPDLPLNAHFAIGNFIRDALWHDEITVNGDGMPIRSYLDQDDLVHWLLTILFQGVSGEAYNVGSDQEISIADLARLVRDLLCPEKTVRILRTLSEQSERNYYLPDIGKARQKLGLDINICLTDSILRTAAAQSQQASWC